jgi:MFS family permease
MFQHVSYLPGFTYIILTALFPYWDVISSGLVANSLVIWILVKLLRLYDQNQPKSLEFNIGLILGISILLYSPIAILIPVVLFALTIIRPFKLAEWLVLLMGILLPFYFIFTFVYLTSGVQEFTHYLPRLDWKNPLIKPNLKILLTLALILVQFLAGLYYWQEQQSRFIIQVRKYWGVLLLVLILTLFQPIIFSTQALYASAIVLTPLACFISFAYSVPKSLFIPNILFWSAIAVIVYNHLG